MGARAKGLCEKHYTRLVRHGDPLVVFPNASPLGDRHVDSATGYVRVKVGSDHPLSRDGHGWVYEHRLVLYESIGPGPQRCHWCERSIGWDVLVADHLDEAIRNNVAGNLVPACRHCNAFRPKNLTGRRDAD